MRKIKLLAGFALLFFLFVFSAAPARAADLQVSCTTGSCSLTGDDPLFFETNVFPGWSKTKVVKAVNNYSQEAAFAIKVVNLASTDGLSDVLTIAIKKTGEAASIYKDSLTNLKNYGLLALSVISGGGWQEYDFEISMQESADNQYQGLNTTFDLNLGFEIIPLEETPTPTPTSAPGATPAPDVCSAAVPSAPTDLTATPASSSVIHLSWTAPPEIVTHYSISYGLSSGSYIYGNANVGKVTSYTVSQLFSGTTYYFIVRAVNDCASSEASNEAAAATTGVLGAFVAAGPAPGFEVLGEQTQIEPEEGEGPVKGIKKVLTCPWWLILSLLLLAVLCLYYFFLSRAKPRKNWWLVPVLGFFLAFVGDQVFAHQAFTPSRFCSFMWLWAGLASIIPTGVYLYFRKK